MSFCRAALLLACMGWHVALPALTAPPSPPAALAEGISAPDASPRSTWVPRAASAQEALRADAEGTQAPLREPRRLGADRLAPARRQQPGTARRPSYPAPRWVRHGPARSADGDDPA